MRATFLQETLYEWCGHASFVLHSSEPKVGLKLYQKIPNRAYSLVHSGRPDGQYVVSLPGHCRNQVRMASRNNSVEFRLPAH